ncbi:efflux RND transporter permease subunit [candidate division CSSED10-310 bacterium]|uniref:Efflux RND transporter permease subunit n=1 Tax=candidate division CSSED10-310 bacterium TaxID=2855610 RepID=A0ABV6Z1K2_UNCC1
MLLPERAVNRPVTTFMVFVAVLLIGMVSLSRLSIDLLPEIDFPSISIFTSYEGVGPEEIETLITRPIEQAVSRVQGIDRVESFSSEGRSRVQLRFAWGVSLDTALNDVRASIERLRGELPEEAETPVIFKFDLSSFPILFLTMSGNMEEWKLRQFAEDTISYRLERLEGVAAVDVRGGLQREIHIDLVADKLASYSVSAIQVAEALRRDNVNLPAGDVDERGLEVIVRTLGEFTSVKQMENVVIDQRDGFPIKVKDVGAVTDSFEDPTNAVYIDGTPGIRLSISKLSGANTVDVADRVKREVDQLNKEFPSIKLKARFDSSEYIRQSISNVEQGITFGAILAVFVLLIFLRSIASTLVVAIAIPIAIVGTFAMMYMGEFTLNMISFGGLALGIGMMVDNSIVILENIRRHQEEGESAREAAIKGSSEVATAITASTVTTLCIFVPVIFISGFAGIFFSQMAFVVSFALICALFVALTLVPVLASRQREIKTKTSSPLVLFLERQQTRLEDRYILFLTKALAHRKTVFLISLALLIGSIMLFPLIGKELMPMGDQGEISIYAELPVNTPLDQTIQTLQEVEQTLRREIPEREVILSVAGPPGFWSDASSNAGTIRLSLVDLENRTRSSEEIANAVRPLMGKIPGLKARVRASEAFFLFRIIRGGGERLSLEIRGYDLKTGSRLAAEVADLMKETPGIVDVDVDRKEGSREMAIVIDPDKAADIGLSINAIGQVVSVYILGRAATYYREAGDEFRVLVRLREDDRIVADQVAMLPIITPSGEHIRLQDVARITRRKSPVSIRRLNQERIITVSSGFIGSDLSSIIADVETRLQTLSLPEGFTLNFGGEYEEQQKTFGQLIIGLFLAMALVYMVMASLFESFLHPFVMLLAIPFAVIGVVLSLLLTGTTFNVYSFLGAIVLTGVVVNNAIVLVDYINMLRREHSFSLTEAITEGSRRRLRPILMTTLTTCLALLPVAIGSGEGGEMQSPLARVIVGGLLTSALITLVFIPTLYATLENVKQRREQKGAGLEI